MPFIKVGAYILHVYFIDLIDFIDLIENHIFLITFVECYLQGNQ